MCFLESWSGMTDFKELINEICFENDINFKLISKDWIMKLEKNGVNKYIVGMKFPLNNYSSSFICDDKYATYEALKCANIPIVEHKLIYNKDVIDGFESDLDVNKDIDEYISRYGKVVVKDNTGSRGIGVFLCSNRFDVLSTLRTIFKLKQTAVISPYIDIYSEYRCICIDDECKLIFEKLRQNGNWKHNLSSGAKAKIVDNQKLYEELSAISIKVMKALNLRFASVDLISSEKGYMVLEVNSGVCMNKFMQQISNGREIAKNIYKEAINKMFE